MDITKDITIEELTEKVPSSVKYLMEKGIRCIVCGEPIWGTLEEAVYEKGFNQDQLHGFVADLQVLVDNDTHKSNDKDNQIKIDKLDI